MNMLARRPGVFRGILSDILLRLWASRTTIRHSFIAMSDKISNHFGQDRMARRVQCRPHNASRVPAESASGPREALPFSPRRSGATAG